MALVEHGSQGASPIVAPTIVTIMSRSRHRRKPKKKSKFNPRKCRGLGSCLICDPNTIMRAIADRKLKTLATSEMNEDFITRIETLQSES